MYNDNNGFNNQNDINNMNQPNMGMMPNNNPNTNIFGQPIGESMMHPVDDGQSQPVQTNEGNTGFGFAQYDKSYNAPASTGEQPVMEQASVNIFNAPAQDMNFGQPQTTGVEPVMEQAPVDNFAAPTQDMNYGQPQTTGFEQPVQQMDNGFGAPAQDMGYGQPMMQQDPYMGMYSQPSFNPEPQPSFNPEPQPSFDNQPNFVPPQFGQQKKDNSGIKFLIGFVVVIAAIVVVALVYWPKISAKMKIKGTWECDNNVSYTFNGDKTYKFEQNYLGSTISYSGTYSTDSGIKDEYKQYKKDGFNYLTLTVVVDKVEYLNQTSNYDQTGTLTFGIKGDEAHIISSANKSVTCKKK